MCIITIGKKKGSYNYYPNSIQEYLILKQEADKSRNRSGLGKKKKTAESGIIFLQYVITQDLFMGKVFLVSLNKMLVIVLTNNFHS